MEPQESVAQGAPGRAHRAARADDGNRRRAGRRRRRGARDAGDRRLRADSQVSTSQSGGSASFTLRIPSRRLEDALKRLSALASVASLSQSSDDITAAFVSARDRLDDARAERKALLRALARAISPERSRASVPGSRRTAPRSPRTRASCATSSAGPISRPSRSTSRADWRRPAVAGPPATLSAMRSRSSRRSPAG